MNEEALSFETVSSPIHTRNWASQHLPEEIRKRIDQIIYKPPGRKFAEGLGLKTPKLYGQNITLYETFELVQGLGLERFVVKPVSGKNSWCVLPVCRVSDRSFYNIIERSERTIEDLIASAWHDYRKYKIAAGSKKFNRWIVEELLLSDPGSMEPIDDYKFYCFFGECFLILHKRNFFEDGKWSSRYRWYNDQWEPVDTGKYVDKIDSALHPPEGGRSVLVETAVETSLKIPVPFVRLDFYYSDGKVYFGEFTQFPGNPAGFSETIRREMGDRWMRASKRLEQAIASGLCGRLKRYFR
ncbi:ATP-grasp fold amidoligase family protein [Bordetella sp. 02P26C-1]|uniref:ATP-grasp fold amidoligase family protein n=1 Tax=Bordetella sp. 02P26C-1 TaxID=2683195 RepID=UPI0013537DBA|nr:ATP-grasp fold amidoligase family protein [Bordetella sp. 02P26C-1]MVW80214.1 hypothetical protein [Bordetella sp. 02P26C-1]